MKLSAANGARDLLRALVTVSALVAPSACTWSNVERYMTPGEGETGGNAPRDSGLVEARAEAGHIPVAADANHDPGAIADAAVDKSPTGNGGASGASGRQGAGGTLGAGGEKDGTAPSAGGAPGTGGGDASLDTRADTNAPSSTVDAGHDGSTANGGIGVLGEPCSPVGALGCTGRAQKGQLVCDSTNQWASAGTCSAHENCDSTRSAQVGSCQPVVDSCVDKNPLDLVCANGAAAKCGADLVSVVPVETCTGAKPVCVAGACVACTPNPTPTRCSGSTPQFCNASGSWQDRTEGQCSLVSSMCQSGSCVPAPKAKSVEAGYNHSCALFDNGTVKCWGFNASGQLGLGDNIDRGDDSGEMGPRLPSVDLGTGRSAKAIAAGASHTCALLDNGAVKCWGANGAGQLGLGDVDSRGDVSGQMGENLPAVELGTGRTATAIAAGELHTCALLDNANVKCWGNNVAGQLGLGDVKSRGDDAGEMGDHLLAVNLGPNRAATAIATGASHTCALLDTEEIKCWGDNGYGRLGIGSTANKGDDPGEMGPDLPAVDLGPNRSAAAVTAGSAHTCALLDNAQIKCWGYNATGQLGLGGAENRGGKPGDMGRLPAVDLGPNRSAVAVTAGSAHTCALLDNAQIKCWGANATGQLGLGDTDNRGATPKEMADLPTVELTSEGTAAGCAAGLSHTCAWLGSGAIKCWGANAAGQLGLGDTDNRGDAPYEMGDVLPAVVLW